MTGHAIGMNTPVKEDILKLNQDQLDHYHEHGWVLLAGFADAVKVQAHVDHYMRLRESGSYPGDMGGNGEDATDPLNTYPRMINMQNWDDYTADQASDRGLLQVVSDALGDAPVLRQTMLYFKPPGARGQGLHQDEQYITSSPLIGAWLALDCCAEDNGCMHVVSGSHRAGHLPVEEADLSKSFVAAQAVLPAGAESEPMLMNAGDLLLFDGKTVHGSFPNVSETRFRRSLIFQIRARATA